MAKEFSITWETRRLNRQVNAMITKFPHRRNIILKKFALDLLKRIVQKNPVDTGRSRAAWYASMRGLGFPGAEGAMQKPARGRNPTRRGINLGKREGKYRERLFLGGRSYIDLINNVRYIMFLEYGSSDQAPYGMVRLSMREMRRGILPKALGLEMQKLWRTTL